MISLLKSTFSSLETRVLLVASERAILYLFEGGEVAQAYIFSADEAGLALFNRCLGELESAPVCILVDVVEEEYRSETIPHVSGSDRRSVLERKYARLFRGTPFHHFLRQGRESNERRDDKVLLTAITRPEILTVWLDVLDEHKAPVAGIYSLPILSERMLKRIGADGTNVLLISLQKASGLRQTFFRDGQLKISRLAHMPRLGSVPFAAHLMGEVEKLRRYLNSLALISRDSPLSIYILSHGQLLDELEQHCRDSEQERFYLLDVEEVGRRFGLKQSGESHYADTVFAKLMVSRTPPNHYARQEDTQFYSMHRLRTALAVAGVMLLLASAGWSGFSFIEGVMLKEQALDAAQKATFYQERFEVARRKLPATPVEPREIKTAVDAIAELESYKSSPEPALALLGKTLLGMPGIKVDEINWHTSTSADDDDEPASMAPGLALDIGTDGGYAYFQITELSAHFDRFGGDFRGAIGEIDRFATLLRQLPDVSDVEVLQYPIDVSSGSRVTGSTTAAVDRTEAAFKLKFTLGVGNGEQES